ncbi:hypothetical protein OPV22_011463 [Ensete ventricosum]|uniref:Uncharacterized protein n=1 Tax=Ensete ventricosum TaxID=4639 RepID=A0AAV8RDI1_ENSVE|nr:hypothetical protein OPV22_011463 [Ensete ventricosum]
MVIQVLEATSLKTMEIIGTGIMSQKTTDKQMKGAPKPQSTEGEWLGNVGGQHIFLHCQILCKQKNEAAHSHQRGGSGDDDPNSML